MIPLCEYFYFNAVELSVLFFWTLKLFHFWLFNNVAVYSFIPLETHARASPDACVGVQ